MSGAGSQKAGWWRSFERKPLSEGVETLGRIVERPAPLRRTEQTRSQLVPQGGTACCLVVRACGGTACSALVCVRPSFRGGCGHQRQAHDVLTKWCHPTRLVTRIKESNIRASAEVANLHA